MKYMIQLINFDQTKSSVSVSTWREAKKAMRKCLTTDALRAVAYEWMPKCNAYSHVGEWTRFETDLLK